MKTLRSLAAALCLLPSFAQAGGGLPPFGTNSPITPSGASQTATLGQVASGSRFLVPRDYIGIWKPFAGNMGIDTGGTIFPTTKTAYIAFEVEQDDVSAVQILFGNQSTSPYTITGVAASGSSQWAAPGYTGATPGITPYDGSGNTLTQIQRATFGAGGVDSDPTAAQPVTAATCLSTSASAAAGQSTISFSATTGVAANAVAYTPLVAANYLYAQTYVSSITSTSVTLSSTVANTIPSGSQVCFLPVSASVQASATPPVQALTRTDWLPITTYPRIDSPVTVGGAVSGPIGIPAGATVSAFGATSITLSSPLTAAVPKGSKVYFCRATTTTASSAPVATLPFASVPATVVPGMYLSLVNGAQFELTQGEGFPSPVTVASVGTTSLTLSQPLGASVGSGRNVIVYQPLTLASAVAAGATSVTVNSAPANLATGMYVFGTGIAGSNGIAFGPNTTITGLSGATLTLSAATSAALNAGDTIYAAVTLATNATASPQSVSVASSAGIYPGALITGAGVAPGSYAVAPGNGALTLSQGPSATLTSGQAINACDQLVTTADAAAGASALTFRTTTYPRRLILVRVDIGSSGVSYWLPSGNAQQTLALWTGSVGAGRIEAGQCSVGNDGVFSPTSISNGSGGCGRNPFLPIWGVKLLTQDRGVVMMPLGDSHFAGDTSIMGAASMTVRAGIAMSSPSLPVYVPNMAFGGVNSRAFMANALPMLQELKPGVVVIAGYTFNNLGTAADYNAYLANVASVSRYVRSYGGLPVIATEYARQVYGCDNNTASGNEPLRLQARTAQIRAANDNSLPILDSNTVLLDPAHPNTTPQSLNPTYSTDCIHANDNGHSAAGAILVNLLRPYLAN